MSRLLPDSLDKWWTRTVYIFKVYVALANFNCTLGIYHELLEATHYLVYVPQTYEVDETINHALS